MTTVTSPVVQKDIGIHSAANCVKFPEDFPLVPYTIVEWSQDFSTVDIEVNCSPEKLAHIAATSGYTVK